ncbi:MAG TPA: metalloregulator ArsR/SmtB family transcription factor [Victivallales bacterium]|nr:metalloregulator ArsR/SmtB family transcription factor [Victivallales bacterium]
MKANIKKYEKRARVIKALGHPSRLLMADELGKGERCVCRLVELIGHDFSTVSKHLTVLRKAGIVEMEKRGKKVFYRLRIPCLLRFMDCVDAV